MPLPVTALKAKALGFIRSIEKLNSPERDRAPTGEYADDYNRLREFTREALPTLQPLLPPTAPKRRSAGGREFSEMPYSEILTFAEQIYQLLDAVNESQHQ